MILLYRRCSRNHFIHHIIRVKLSRRVVLRNFYLQHEQLNNPGEIHENPHQWKNWQFKSGMLLRRSYKTYGGLNVRVDGMIKFDRVPWSTFWYSYFVWHYPHFAHSGEEWNLQSWIKSSLHSLFIVGQSVRLAHLKEK